MKSIKSNEVTEIARAIRIALGLEYFSPQTHEGGGGGIGGGKSRGVPPSKQRLILIGDIEDETDPEFKKHRYYRLSDAEEDGFRTGDYDLTENDLNDEFDIVELIPRAEDYLDLDPKMEAIRVQGMKNAMAIQAQFLPTQRSEMSLWEIGNIFSYIDHKLQAHASCGYGLESVILLGLTLVYGRSVEELCEMRIHNSPINKLPSRFHIAYIKSMRCLQMSIATPEYRTSLSHEKAAEAIPVDDSMFFVCPPILADALEDLAEGVRSDKKRSGYQLFTKPRKQYEQSVRRLVRKYAESDVTEVALRRHIFQKILYESGDIADAMMVTRQKYVMPGTRLHYTTRPKALLSLLHSRTVGKLIAHMVEEFDLCNGTLERWTSGIMPRQKGYVGARLTPRFRAVRKLVRKLRAKLKEIRSENWIEFHNAYTAYCIVMLDYVTTSRAVARKYFLESDMDFKSNLALVWDKNVGDTVNSRVVHLPDTCIQQIKEYRKHRQVVIERIAVLQEAAFSNLSDPANQNPTSFFRTKLREHVNNRLGQFFFLDKAGCPKQLHPKLIREQLEGIFHLSPNVNRHYFRFNMCNAGIAGEIVDAYLGHSSWGEESSGRYSSMSLGEIIEQVKPKLEKIMIRDGWTVERGF